MFKKRKYKILFVDFSTKLESLGDLKSRARGGMVSSLVRVPNELAKRGHEVMVLSDIKKDEWSDGGVLWCAKDGRCQLKGEKWDFLVLNRGVGEGYSGLESKHRILWTHDLPHNGFIPEPKMMHGISGVVFMSRYAEHLWRTFYKTIGASWLIPNGVDREMFYPRKKDLDYIVYGSAPNRGLKRLPLIFDAIRTRLGRSLKMEAYSNLSLQHPNESGDYGEDYEKVAESKVTLNDPLPQEEWAEKLGRAGLMILPTDYPEICSNNVLQTLASGVPIVTTGDLGSANEWVKDGVNGSLTRFQVNDYMIHTVEIVRNALGILEDKDKHWAMIKNAVHTRGIYEWEEIGVKWEKMFRKLI